MAFLLWSSLLGVVAYSGKYVHVIIGSFHAHTGEPGFEEFEKDIFRI